MSCQKCDEAQDEEIIFYYRWKNANIEISSCDEHGKEIIEALNKIQHEMAKK